MPRPRIDLTGLSFNWLTVLSFSKSDRLGALFWLCKCKCGNEKVIRGDDLKFGGTKSCGCLIKEWKANIGKRNHEKSLERKKYLPEKIVQPRGHGMSKTRVYRIWCSMRGRCLNKNNASYPYYGGRGITICDRWEKFEHFLEDMGHPRNEMTLERIDNNGNYCPENCCWATRSQQSKNRRVNIVIEYHGENLSLHECCERFGLSYTALYSRLYRGMSIEESLHRPLGRWVKG